MNLKFHKMQGCGNDFLVLDAINSSPPRFRSSEVRYLCNRWFGIGADGLVILSAGQSSELAWEFYNSDGSEAEMCGNAARCAIRYAVDRYFPGEGLIGLETKAGVIRGRKLDPTTVEVMLLPQKGLDLVHTERVLQADENTFQLYCIDTGVPHAVLEVKDIDTYPIDSVGRAIQKHPAFTPDETNVTFFQRISGKRIQSTTYERGVEGETFACGTGAAAAALVFSELYLENLPIVVQVPGGELEVDISPVSRVLLLRGPAEYVMEVELDHIPNDFSTPVLYGARRRKGGL